MSDSPTLHPLILVIGFSATIQKIFQTTFSREGITVTQYQYADATAKLSAELPAAPDVLFVDLDLSGGHGYPLVRRLRSRFPSKQAVIIGVTAHKGIFFRLKARWVGVDVFLSKPVISQELIQAVMVHSRH